MRTDGTLVEVGGLVDRYGRVATDLRVSLTDRCSLRCAYCMPPEGLPWLPRAELLSDDEVVRLVRVAVSLGVTEVRLTGGEPLLRPGTRPRWPLPGWTGSTSRWTPWTLAGSGPSPSGTGIRTSWPGWRRPGPPAWSRSR